MQDPTCLLSSQNAFHKEKAYIKTDLYVYVCNKQTKFTENNILERNSSFTPVFRTQEENFFVLLCQWLRGILKLI